ncbi:MAG TPA: tetratricopeptide repeat protein [Candidatus Polarisedimenticolia bacterium]|nr:tetratricopeptide repeat protein [Candidatus Polarisedimenticolia bacterium]
MTGRWSSLLAGPLLALLLYIPTLGHDFVFDDRGVIEANPLMHDIRDLPRLFVTPYWNAPLHSRLLYRPLTSASFALDRAISGMRPAWFHAVNVALHALATLLVAGLALELLPGRPAAAAVAGALFAVHPVHVEAVAGIVGRAEILAAIGVLSAIACHRRALLARPERATLWVAAAWVSALGGVLAKESAIVTPLLVLLAERTMPGVQAASRARRLVLHAGYGMVALGYLGIRAAVLGTIGPGQPIPFVDNPAAAAGAVAGRLTGLGTLARYARLLLWPDRLSADYSYDQIPVIRSLFDPLAILGLLILVAVVVGGARLVRRAPACAFALLFTAATACLTTNVVLFIGTLLAERLMYLPSVGLCLLAGWAVGRSTGPRARWILGGAAALAVLLLAGRSWARIPEWKDDFSLYSSAARVSPRSARIRYNLGNGHLKAGRYAEAEMNYREALRIYPEFQDARVNLGMALLQLHRAQDGLALLEAAVRLDPQSADLAVNVGTAYQALGDEARAEAAFRRALELDPRSARAWNNLGSIELRRGNAEEAAEVIARAVAIDPHMAVFRVNLADALNAAARTSEAAEQFREAYRIDPDLPEAHRGLGEVALSRGDLETAEREFRLAAGARVPSARAANFLGYVLTRTERYSEAVVQYEKAIAIQPDLADAHASLGLLYAARAGDRARAIEHLRTSLRLDPAQARAEDLRALLDRLEKRQGGVSGPGARPNTRTGS